MRCTIRTHDDEYDKPRNVHPNGKNQVQYIPSQESLDVVEHSNTSTDDGYDGNAQEGTHQPLGNRGDEHSCDVDRASICLGKDRKTDDKMDQAEQFHCVGDRQSQDIWFISHNCGGILLIVVQFVIGHPESQTR